jgi:thiamine-phosphate pyrophosphorylase
MISRLYPILLGSDLRLRGEFRDDALLGLMDELLSAGVTLLQYRHKMGDEAEVLADAAVLRDAAAVGECTLILNDFAGLVTRVGFDGVHVGQDDMDPELARAAIGAAGVLGLSTHNAEQVVAADLTSADYLAIGPVFATSTKLNPDPVVGLEGVRRARSLTKKPLVAIGGITLENCEAVMEAGADSVAVISGLFADASGRAPGKIASDFLSKLR